MTMTINEAFEQVKLDESLLTVAVKREDVFNEIHSLTTQILSAEKAERGDLVLIGVSARGGEEEISLNVGKGYFPEYESAVLGKKKGEEILIGEERILVKSVKRIFIPEVSDEILSALGVKSLEEYEENYIAAHEEELKRTFMRKYHKTIDRQLVNAVSPEVSEEDVEEAYKKEREELLKDVGGDRESYEETLKEEFSKKDIFSAEAAFKEYCASRLKRAAVGKMFAAEEGKEIADSEGERYLGECVRNYYWNKIKIVTKERNNG